jgi:hypothetical protein
MVAKDEAFFTSPPMEFRDSARSKLESPSFSWLNRVACRLDFGRVNAYTLMVQSYPVEPSGKANERAVAAAAYFGDNPADSRIDRYAVISTPLCHRFEEASERRRTGFKQPKRHSGRAIRARLGASNRAWLGVDARHRVRLPSYSGTRSTWAPTARSFASSAS